MERCDILALSGAPAYTSRMRHSNNVLPTPLTIKPSVSGCYECAVCFEYGGTQQGSDGKHYCPPCAERLIANGEAERYRNSAHRRGNPVWQVNYEVFTVSDLKGALQEHSRLPLLNSSAEQLLTFFCANPDASWDEAAKYLGRQLLTIRDTFERAMYVYQRRKENPAFRPRMRLR